MSETIVKPSCLICGLNKKQVPKLVKLHNKYMCSNCCEDCKELMSEDTKLGDKTLITGNPDGDIA